MFPALPCARALLRPSGRRILVATLTCLAALWASGVSAAESSLVAIRNGSGKCVDVPGSSYRAGVPLQAYPCHYGPNQTFKIIDLPHPPPPPPTVDIPNDLLQPMRAQWLCVDARSGLLRPGDVVQLFSCHSGPNQRWFFDGPLNSDLKWRSAAPGRLCVAPGPPDDSGKRYLVLARCTNGSDQLWRVVRPVAP
jgi:hypothetical protein